MNLLFSAEQRVPLPASGRTACRTRGYRTGELRQHLVHDAFGSKDDLKAGAAFRAQAATKQPDGTYMASAVVVGRDGARPF